MDTGVEESKEAHGDSKPAVADHSELLTGGQSGTMHKKTERIKELEQEIFDLKKRLERSESRVVKIVFTEKNITL